ncbi:MAG TPA: beta-ketoacyl-[acyl-carrier-protein] synthase family protein [Myxococcales bacterium]|nr:beta-ketoacyl-[acyl-carrier-protein] synthase family protein [Myxococcales bacterium]
MEEVAITGIGLVSCLGHELTEVARALRDGRSGIVRDPEREALGFRSPLTGAIRGFDPAAYLSRKERRSMGEPALYGAVAALRALADAGLPRDSLSRPEVGVVLGNDSAAEATRRAVDETRAARGTRGLGSGAVVEAMTSSATINLSVLLGTRGACWTVAGACASGAHAVGQAAALAATNQQDVVLAGGVQEINWAGSCAFDGLGAFSTRGGDPAEASRPFSADRDGLVPSGGGAVLVLERRAHAEARGARIRGLVRAYAFSSDGVHVTAPGGDGARWCMRRALALAKMAPDEIDYVNAHATGTPLGDAVEAAAIRDVFGTQGPPVSSTKSLTGHECWMAGASELAYTLLMMEHGFIAATRNLATPDPACEGLDLPRQTRDRRPRTALSNSFGFGGTNACIVVEAAG